MPTLPLVAAALMALLTLVFISSKWAMRLSGKKTPKAKFLNKQRQSVKLGARFQISHDTVRFRFVLPKETPVLGLPVAKHFKLFAPNPKASVAGKWNGRDDPEADEHEIERKYTPTSSDDDVGFVDLVIKVYKGGVKPNFPDGGKMSQYMEALKVGDSIDISGPWGVNQYLGHGKFKIGSKELVCSKLGMMAGGTGITPMLQVMTAILKDPTDKTTISLLYANQTESDILVREMLDELAAQHPAQLKIWYTVDQSSEGWAYSTGYITEQMIAEHLPPPDDGTLVLMCGPPPMVKFACIENLKKLKYPTQSQISF